MRRIDWNGRYVASVGNIDVAYGDREQATTAFLARCARGERASLWAHTKERGAWRVMVACAWHPARTAMTEAA